MGLKQALHWKILFEMQKFYLTWNISQWINLGRVWLILANNRFSYYFCIHKELAAAIRQVTDLFKHHLVALQCSNLLSLAETAERSPITTEKWALNGQH